MLQDQSIPKKSFGAEFGDEDDFASGLPAYQYADHQPDQQRQQYLPDSASVISLSTRRLPTPPAPIPPPPPPPIPDSFNAEFLLRENIPSSSRHTTRHAHRDSTLTTLTEVRSITTGRSTFKRRDNRDVYYNIFEDHNRIRVKAPHSQLDPYTSSINTLNLPPPRTIQVLKRYIATIESMDPLHISAIYLTPDDDALADHIKLMNVIEDHGSTADSPITVMIDRKIIGEPLLLESSGEYAELGCLQACGLLKIAKPDTTRDKVASSDRPLGWIVANIAAPCHLGTLKVDKAGVKQAWGRQVGDKMSAGTTVYVDPRSFVWNGGKAYRVINPASHDIGYCTRVSLRFDPANGVVPD